MGEWGSGGVSKVCHAGAVHNMGIVAHVQLRENVSGELSHTLSWCTCLLGVCIVLLQWTYNIYGC